MFRFNLTALLLFSGLVSIFAQAQVNIKITDATTKESILGVTIMDKGKVIAITDTAGVAVISLPKGQHELTCSSVGYESQQLEVACPYQGILEVSLQTASNELEEVSVVASTRNNQAIESSPMKVEVLGKEELEEENTVKPANIGSLLSDISGVQIQQSSPVSGNSNVRIQGLDGRYTQILRDGMPLFDGFSGGFGILSIPPLDLKQLELIKGSASTLYGGGAIGGLINIISRTPSDKQYGVLTVNQTTLGETNTNAFFSKRFKKVGYTFFAAYTNQAAVDVNKDGFSDLAQLGAVIFHPRLFWYLTDKTTITLGYNGTFERRNGGDMNVISGKPDVNHLYFEKNTTSRNSEELMLQSNLSNGAKLDFKNSISSFDRNITTNSHNFIGNQTNYFSELSVMYPWQKNSLVAGINLTGDQFSKSSLSDPIQLPNFSNTIVGGFAQGTWNIQDKVVLEAGVRNDYHLQFGNFVLPRLALFYRINPSWATRAGVGMGYKTPNPFAPQLVEYDIEKIQMTNNLTPEKSVGYNFEFNYKKVWDDGTKIFINQAFFLTQLDNPIVANEDLISGNVSFSNQSKPVISKGADTYIRTVLLDWELYLGYTFTLAERTYLSTNQFMPITPKHRFAFTLVKDFDQIGLRFGAEGSYVGSQYRMDGSLTPGYYFIAALVEKKLGKHISIVLNAENLLDFRQSSVESQMYTGTISHPTFNALWAPIDGRVINLAIKYQL
jgi:outer membrane receptor for ferrienterochelin and colicins